MADSLRLARVVQVCARGFGKLGRERARAGDITPQQADALEVIEARGVVSTGTLATTLGIDPSTASRNISCLARAGLITRKGSADDRRQSDIRLTPKGKRMAETLGTETLRAFNAVLDRVPRAERQRVVDALGVLAQAVTAGEPRS
jgi:DNA-binding MarR family transcriptional regulator